VTCCPALVNGRAGYKSGPQDEHLGAPLVKRRVGSRDEPTEHGDCMDAAVRLEWTWNRLLVPEGLVRTRFVVVADVLGDDAPEVIVTEDEEVAELFFTLGGGRLPAALAEAIPDGHRVRAGFSGRRGLRRFGRTPAPGFDSEDLLRWSRGYASTSARKFVPQSDERRNVRGG